MRIPRIAIALIFGALLFPASRALVAQKALKPATQQEESFMFGRILGAIQDVGGGFTKEALGKFPSINKDLEKRQYAPRTRWLAHYWYGKALLDDGKARDALRILQTAQKEAESLTEKEQKDTAELLRQAEAKVK